MPKKAKAPAGEDHAKLERLLAKAGLTAQADAIRAAAKIGLELVPRALEAELPFAASRLGGAPDFPAGDSDWPEGMRFLAELNLAEIVQLGLDLPLPPGGLLSFFVLDGEDEDGDYLGSGWTQLDTKIPKKGVWRVGAPKDIAVSPAFAVDLVPRLTLPCPGTSEFRALKLRGDAATAYDDEVYAKLPRPKHVLLGCKNTDLDDIAANALLLSLDSDKRLGWKWGDGNRVNFEITKKDLEKGKLAEAFPTYVDA